MFSALACTALIALLLDALIGWPDRLYRRIGHPVGLFAAYLSATAQRWNNQERSFAARRLAGLIVMIGLIALTLFIGHALTLLAVHLFGPWAVLVIALLAWPAFAQRSLWQHGKAVADALDQQGLGAGRQAVAQICGRDVVALDQHGVSRAAIESLAESLSDGIIAPLFWLLIGGLPALWAYKAINTADSMIGHKDSEWRAFGWAAARLDDVANLIPARLSGLLICLCQGRGVAVMMHDHGKHASPNSGWPEAAMAGALGLRLAGPISYDGERVLKPWIGHGRAEANSADIRAALRLLLRCFALSWLIAGGLLWLP
jgi:adenosylcobinamide-phosphate synthase